MHILYVILVITILGLLAIYVLDVYYERQNTVKKIQYSSGAKDDANDAKTQYTINRENPNYVEVIM